jgi:hypothetical protein
MLSEASYHNMTVGRIPSVEGGIQPTIVDAKGDLIAAVAADSLNRLAVGSNDQVLVADSAASTGLAWKSYGAQFVAGKNKIINGDFTINQRAFTSTTTQAVYTFDRWRTTVVGDGTSTFTAQTFTPGAAPVSGYEGSNYLRIVTTGQTAAGTFTDIRQRIESVRTLAGQTATVSFWAKAASGTPKVAIELQQGFGSGGSATVQIYAGQVTLSTSWARYSLTVAIPSISGKTVGPDVTSDLQVELVVSAGSDFNARTGSLGIQSNTFEFWGVQVEAGSVATPFTTATGTIQGELAACQRYYRRWTAGTAYGTLSMFGTGLSSTQTICAVPIMTMRVTPTSVDYANINAGDGTNSYAVTALSLNQGNENAVWLLATTASGLVQYRPTSLVGSNNTAGFIGLSAEL